MKRSRKHKAPRNRSAQGVRIMARVIVPVAPLKRPVAYVYGVGFIY